MICSAVYLIVAAVLWISALPDYFDAVDGIAPNGGRIGPLPYAITAYVASVLLTIDSFVGVRRLRTPATAEPDRSGSELPAPSAP
ncbi:hypothetical protein [Gordonia sputi]